MDFITFRDTMLYATDLSGLVAYVASISIALFGVALTTYADERVSVQTACVPTRARSRLSGLRSSLEGGLTDRQVWNFR